jgi:hypothetical protein
MTTLPAYAPERAAREHRLEMLRLRRQAARTEGLVRALVLAVALATLAVSLNGALKGGAVRVASALENAGTTSVR